MVSSYNQWCCNHDQRKQSSNNSTPEEKKNKLYVQTPDHTLANNWLSIYRLYQHRMHDNAVHCVEQPTFHKMMPGLNQKELLKQKQAKQQQHNDLPISNPCTDIKYKFMIHASTTITSRSSTDT